MALGANARREDLHGVPDPGRALGRDDGAGRTTATEEGRLEGDDVVDSDELADMRARRGVAAHAQRQPADAQLGVGRETAHAGKAGDGDLLAQVAGLQTERLVRREVDDHDRTPGAVHVRVALDATADAADDLGDSAWALPVALVEVETDDACVHAPMLEGAPHDGLISLFLLDDLEAGLHVHRERADIVHLRPARRVDLAEDRIRLRGGHAALA